MRLSILGPFLACLALFGGCARTDPPVAPESRPPERVVVLAPAAAEMLDALGLVDRVVGIGEFGPWPGTTGTLPRVGGYDAPNLERIVELRADAVVTTESRAASPAHRDVERLGVRVVALDTSTFRGVLDSLIALGRLFGREARAEGIAARLSEELRAIEQQASGLPRPRVLVVVGRDPLYVAGPGSHIDEMIRLVGGANTAADALSPYPQVSLEAALERRPEIIVDTSDNRPSAPRGRIAGDWARWPFLPAVESGRVYQVDPGRLVIPGLRLPEMTRLMARLVHPEVFGEPERGELGP